MIWRRCAALGISMVLSAVTGESASADLSFYPPLVVTADSIDGTTDPANVSVRDAFGSHGLTTNQLGTLSTSWTSPNPCCGSGNATISSSYSYGSGSVSATVNVQAGTSYVANGFTAAQASVGLTYYFEVTGPQFTTATLDITASGGLSGTGAVGYNQTTHSLLLIDPYVTAQALGYTLELGTLGQYQSPTTPIAWSATNLPFNVSTNRIYTISLYASVYAPVYFGQSASLTAFVDPSISIDPGNSDASQLQLFFSPAIGAVPEPSTWAMMFLGFCVLGILAHRRKNQIFGARAMAK